MKKICFVILLLCALLLSSCAGGYKEENFFCMDTYATVMVDSNKKSTIKECRELLEKLDLDFSRHNEKGIAYIYNASDEGVETKEEIKEVIDLADEISFMTDGAFSVFSGGLTSLWENSKTYPDEETIEKAVQSVEKTSTFDVLFLKKTNKDTKLEFGGIAKGYACDKAVDYLKNNGVESGMISFSSSVGVFGKNPEGDAWKIAIKDPINTDSILGYVSLSSGGLSVSGDYERYYEIDGKKYNHIIDPKTGRPVDNGVHSVVVVCESAAKADALSTAFFVMGYEYVEQKFAYDDEISYLFVTDDGVFMNEGMETIFTKN